MFENVKIAVQTLEDNLTLKSNYIEELEQLQSYENDLPVLRYLGTPIWKIRELTKQINHIREWIKEETAYQASRTDEL